MNGTNGYASLTSYVQAAPKRYENDGHIGIPYEITVYYDSATHGAARPGFMTCGATPVILYVINANVERIGTESDEKIIGGMLSRGYAVAVADYLGDKRARSPMLDTSAQLLRSRLSKGEFFVGMSAFPEGTYGDGAIVPAGYDIRMNDVYFSLDKHGTDGTLEKIVNVWNNDFRMYRKKDTVKWIRADGSRKPTQAGFDGSDPLWYADAAGESVDMERGVYTRVEYTDAQHVTDCVCPDGRPIDLDLYMHVTYPTRPEKCVPVMAMFASTGTASEGNGNPTRPQFAGFLFGGYAAAVFDYAWIPMGRSDHFGYFDGSSGEGRSVSGDNMSYATYTYNATQTVTAALRYLRYLALSEPDVYRFNIDKIGSFGISKASWATQLGAPALRENLLSVERGLTEDEIAERVNNKINSFVQMYYLEGHDGSTRYDMGYTEDVVVNGVTVRGGERQPWAVWNGREISSGAQMVYSCCGGFIDYLCKEYAPLFITENLQDTCNTEYGQQNILVNLCRNMDIPSLWFEADIAHTFAIGNDARYGVDIYNAFFRFADYYLKDAAPQVVYTLPEDGGCIAPTDRITLRMIGEFSRAEIERVCVQDASGRTVTGTWQSAYGDTEWYFTPADLLGGTEYVLALPATLTAKNGVPLGKEYSILFRTRKEEKHTVCATRVQVDTSGVDVTFDLPNMSAGNCTLRLLVENDAANLLVISDGNTGRRIGETRVSGAGFYEIALGTDGWELDEDGRTSVRLSALHAAGAQTSYVGDTVWDRGGFIPSADTELFLCEKPEAQVLTAIRKPNVGKYKGGHVFYHNMEGAVTMRHEGLINGGAPVTAADMGRRFLIRLRLFDRISRPIRFWMSNATSRADKRLDFDRVYYTAATRAGEWCDYTVPYTVYESKYGLGEQLKTLYVQFTPTGSTEVPVLIGGIRSEEIFTDVCVSQISIVKKEL